MRAPLEECESAGAIKALGANASLIDAPAEKLSDKKFISRIKDYSPDLLVVVTTFGSLELDLEWAKILRRSFPEIDICLRGAPCYVNSERILRQSNAITFCIRGEYENVFKSLLTLGYREALGTAYLHDEKYIEHPVPLLEKNLDLLPLPDRKILKSSLYRVRGRNKNQATIRVQRGCPYTCTYCLVHLVNGNQARHRSPESITKEMSELIVAGTKYFYLRADTFTQDKKWVIATCEAIKINCPEAKWVTTTRIDRVDADIIKAMKEAGCYGISFGVDVASKRIAEQVLKRTDFSRAEQTMRLCDQFGIVSLAYIMIGFVWDDRQSVKEAKDFILGIRPDLITVHFAHPYPGTVYYDQVQEVKQSIKLINANQAQSAPAIETAVLSQKYLLKISRKIQLSHYLRPQVILKIVKKVVSI